MPTDNRYWYRDQLRKRTGYVERSKFRSPDSGPPRDKKPPRFDLWTIATIITIIYLVLRFWYKSI